MHRHFKRTAIAVAVLSTFNVYAADKPTSEETAVADRAAEVRGKAKSPMSTATKSTPTATDKAERKALLERVKLLETRLNEMQALLVQQMKTSGNAGAAPENKTVAARLNEMETRLNTVETTTVLSEPKTAVKQIQVYVDANGNEYDHPVEGATPTITYQRERVYRRQTISEAIAEALEDDKKGSVALGVSNVTTAQMAFQTSGTETPANRHVYGLSAADVTFRAKSAALNTEFYADLVGIGGSSPNQEIPGAINLMNSQAARLSNNQLNVREAWIRTELMDQKLGLSIGRLDLTNYFDRNAVANDETERFINDALVNNPVLGLTTNGLGFAAVYDPKNDLNFKLGVQQSNDTATSLSSSLYSLAEVEYLARPFSLPEGHYRLWARSDNSSGSHQRGYGVSVDQKISANVTLFGRYGNGDVASIGGKMKFYSGGVAFQGPYTYNPLDAWGLGYAQTELFTGNTEKVAETFYNLHVTDHLGLSFLLQYVMDSKTQEKYLVPGLRMKVGF